MQDLSNLGFPVSLCLCGELICTNKKPAELCASAGLNFVLAVN